MHAFTGMNSGILNSLFANIFCVSLSVWCNNCPCLVAIIGHRAFAKKIKVHFFLLFSLYWSTNIFSDAKWKKNSSFPPHKNSYSFISKIYCKLIFTTIRQNWPSKEREKPHNHQQNIWQIVIDNSLITHYLHN